MGAARRGTTAVVVVPTLVLLAAGCASGADGAGSSAGSAPRVAPVTADVQRGASCVDDDVLSALGLVLDPSLRTEAPAPTTRGLPPEGFVADSVLLCDRGATMRDSVGTWWSVTATRLEGDLTPLVAAARRAPTPATCAPGVVAQVWLVDALGSAVLLPSDAACAGDGDVPAALDGLDVVDRTEHPVALVGPTAGASAP